MKRILRKLGEKTSIALSNEEILKRGEQIVQDIKSLNELLFSVEEDFSLISKKPTIFREMSQEANKRAKTLIEKIEKNINTINEAIKNTEQLIPLDQKGMDGVMVKIMTQYVFTSNELSIENISGENHALNFNSIHTALNNLSKAIDKYNEDVASIHNWPKIKSINETLTLVKQQLVKQSIN
jgi:hypothetical protein